MCFGRIMPFFRCILLPPDYLLILPTARFFCFRRTKVTPKAKIMDEVAVGRAMARISYEIVERNRGFENICIFGVKRRGVYLARMLGENINKFWNTEVPIGDLDVTRHRDDLTDEDKRSNAGQSYFPCDIKDKTVIIVDDVLYTGRTARAAKETVFAYGRPRSVQYVVLIDRGHRELPIRPDYIGKNVPTSENEVVKVLFNELDGESGVYICDK